MTHEDIVKLVEKYPNDMQLGREVRQLYWQERDKVIREGLDLPAQQSITEGTSVTRVETQLELPINSKTTVEYKPDHRGYPF